MELVPDEILVYILQYALPAIGRELHDTREAFMVRETSHHFKEVIDIYLLGNVTQLSSPRVAPRLSATQLCLFKRLHTLQIEYRTELSNTSLSQLTSLKTLLLRVSVSAITEHGLSVLTGLECLELNRPTESQAVGLRSLTKLQTLLLTLNSSITDRDIACLSSLRALHLDNDGLVAGSGFSSQLEELNIQGHFCCVKDSFLCKVATQLRTLRLESEFRVLNPIIREMTNLKKLWLSHNKTIGDATLSLLTSLDTLRLINVPSITDQSLSRLSQLTSLTLAGTGQNVRSPAGLTHLKSTLKTAVILEQRNFTLEDFLPYTALQSIGYAACVSVESDRRAAELLRARGVKLGR